MDFETLKRGKKGETKKTTTKNENKNLKKEKKSGERVVGEIGK